MFYSEYISKKVYHTYKHHQHGTELPHGIAAIAHGKREYSASYQAHNHKPRHLILLGWKILKSLGENDGKDIGVSESDEGDAEINDALLAAHAQPYHGSQHKEYADDEEGTHTYLPQEEASQETSGSTEDKVKTGGKSGFFQAHAYPFLQYFRSSGIGAHINAHMAHDTYKR